MALASGISRWKLVRSVAASFLSETDDGRGRGAAGQASERLKAGAARRRRGKLEAEGDLTARSRRNVCARMRAYYVALYCRNISSSYRRAGAIFHRVFIAISNSPESPARRWLVIGELAFLR